MEHGVGVRTSQSGCWLLQQDAQHVALSGSAQHWHVTQSPKSIRYTHTHTQWNVSDMDVRQQQCSSHQQQISAALIAQPNSDWGSSYQNSMLWFCHDLLAALKPSAHLTQNKKNICKFVLLLACIFYFVSLVRTRWNKRNASCSIYSILCSTCERLKSCIFYISCSISCR